MKNTIKFVLLLAIVICQLYSVLDAATVAEVTHSVLQANDQDGVPVYITTDKVIVDGVILNNPEYMLDPTPGPEGVGGQWQIFVQPDEPNDLAGTAVWMGQNYSNFYYIFGDYDDPNFIRELCDINFDTGTGYRFNAGDKVRVEGYYKSFGGKLNINEKHMVSDDYDLTIELIEPAAGLPKPEVITLDMVKDGPGQSAFSFYGADRTQGVERYQGRLVRVNDVNIVDPQNWGPNNYIQVEDADGYTFDVHLGIGNGFELFDAPTGPIDVIGIFNQEAPGCEVCDYGYEIWVTNYDGNGLVLTDRGQQRGNLPGDVNFDATVNLIDFSIIAQRWLNTVPGLYGCD